MGRREAVADFRYYPDIHLERKKNYDNLAKGTSNLLKSSQAISHVNVELITNVSEIIFISFIRVDQPR